MTEEQKPPQEKKPKAQSMGLWVVIGIAIGTALGAALNSLPAGLAIGIALGLAIGAAQTQKDKNKHP